MRSVLKSATESSEAFHSVALGGLLVLLSLGCYASGFAQRVGLSAHSWDLT